MVRCDQCGETIDTPGKMPLGWRPRWVYTADGGHMQHACPDCSGASAMLKPKRARKKKGTDPGTLFD